MKHLVRSFAALALAALAGIILARTGGDLALARRYFTPGEGWTHSNDSLIQFLYRYGPWLAVALSIGGFVLGLRSAFGPQRRSLAARQAWFLPLLLLLGPGLLVNAVGKDNWGRPRPKQVQEFGGPDTYITAGAIGPVAKDRKSFPSGHASMGFYLLAGYFIWRGRRPLLARASLAAGLVMGAAIGWARIVQGGHFLSDVIWAGAVVYLAGELLAWAWLGERPLAAPASGRHPSATPSTPPTASSS
jgi:membrane-associated PAP2 superfamily phosphatase